MRIVLQRVARASVRVESETVGEIGAGFVLFVGIAHGDDVPIAERLAAKCVGLRIFRDDDGRSNRSVVDVGGEAMVVSQFTLLADSRRGRRPAFTDAAPPEIAEPLVQVFARALRAAGIRVATGRFGAMMEVELVNDGPVTIVLDSVDFDRPRNR